MQAPKHRPAKEDVDPGVQDLVPCGHAQVDEQLVLCGPRQLPGGAHDRRCLQQGLRDEDLQEQRVVLCGSSGATSELRLGPGMSAGFELMSHLD